MTSVPKNQTERPDDTAPSIGDRLALVVTAALVQAALNREPADSCDGADR